MADERKAFLLRADPLLWKAIEKCPELSGGIAWSWADYYHRRNYIKYAAFGPYGCNMAFRRWVLLARLPALC